MTKKLLSLITNPYLIALLLSLFVIWLIPDIFNRYTIELTEKQICASEGRVYFEDLDGDGFSERIESQENSFGNASFLIYDSTGNFIDQYNLQGKHLSDKKIIHLQDTDHNKLKEIYVLTRRADSLFLNYLENYKTKAPIFTQTFVDTVEAFDGKYNINYIFHHNKNDSSKVYFVITMGFGGSTRSIFYFDSESKSLVKSPHLTNASNIHQFANIDNDSENELLLSSNTSGNTIDSVYTKRSDYSAWLSVLDDNLTFAFEPIEFKALGSVQSMPITYKDEKCIISVFKSRQYEIVPSQILILSKQGDILRKKIIPDKNYRNTLKMGNKIGLSDRVLSEINLYDNNLNLIDQISLDDIAGINLIDADSDGINELLGLHTDSQRATIYRSNFEDDVTFKYSNFTNSELNFGIKENGNSLPQIYFQKSSIINLFTYQKNSLYHLKYLIYLGIYGATLGLVFLIIKGQKIRDAKSKKIEDEIAELQLKTIKNQVDPHFVFNAVNTLSELHLMDNKLEADQFIVEFSDLMRNTLSESDKISTTIKTELNYVENYLRLQRIRLNNSFDYEINVSNKVDKATLIPKHSLYTFVENAVKYGLNNPSDLKVINIDFNKVGECIHLVVEDNGLGLESEKDSAKSTGSGLGIISQIFQLYQKRYKNTISYSINTIRDKNNEIKGTKVEVKICGKKRK